MLDNQIRVQSRIEPNPDFSMSRTSAVALHDQIREGDNVVLGTLVTRTKTTVSIHSNRMLFFFRGYVALQDHFRLFQEYPNLLFLDRSKEI